ncbi:sigma-70 family RNA polymerase sigma factor [Streptomyces sp. NPDC004610]|uniref:RNA polymerase sigma factor n=1 Tax=unclassified Streptomyces TaxID=2593676 RepID=UPI0033B2B291
MTEQQARLESLAQVVVEPLHRYLLRRTHPDLAEDVLAETLLVLWRRIDDVPGFGPDRQPPDPGLPPDPGDVLPWCYGVARGCLANARRAEGRRVRLLERLIRGQERRPAVTAAATDHSDHSDLYAALDTLTALDREVVQLWAWEELTPRQIAEVTGLTPNAVSIRLHRAKKRLAARLGRKDAERPGHKRDEGRSSQ